MEAIARLDSNALAKIGSGGTPFDSGLHNGVKWFIDNALRLREQFTGPNVRMETYGLSGPGLNMRDFGQKVIVPLLKISIGRYLNRAQAGNLAAFFRLISSTFKPASLPQAQTEFHMLFDITEQRVAQTGNLQTVGGGSTTTTYDIVMSLERKIVTTEIDSMELFYTNDPLVIAESITRELESMQTALDLSVILEHAKFCARQPLLGEMCGLREAARQNDLTDGAIIRACQLENIVCGSLNRSPKNLVSLLHTALKILDISPKDAAVVTTNTVFQNSSLDRRLVESQVGGSDEVYIYSVNGAVGMQPIAKFGKTVPPGEGLRAFNAPVPEIAPGVTRSAYGGLKSVDDVMAIHLGNNETIPVIPLDSTKFSVYGNTSVETAMTQECIKRLFFTVGTCPNIYDSLEPGSFFGPSSGMGEEITPAMVAMRSPRSTYIMDLDRGDRVQEITLRQLHRVFLDGNRDAFDINGFARKISRLTEALEKFNEAEVANLFLEPEWERKMADPGSIFEFDPRQMLIEIPDAEADDVLVVGVDTMNDKAYAAVHRTCMYNSSSLSMKHNEMIGVLSSMLQLVGQSSAITNYCQLVQTALSDTSAEGVEAVNNIRHMDLTGANVPLTQAMVDKITLRGGRYLPLSDPYCQLAIIKYFDNPDAITDAGNRVDVVQTVVNTIRAGFDAIVNVFKTIFDDPDFSIFSVNNMPKSICATQALTATENLFMNIAYAAILPIFTDTLASMGGGMAVDTETGFNGMVFPVYRNTCFIGSGATLPNQVKLWELTNVAKPLLVRAIWKCRTREIMKTFGGQNPFMGFLYHLHLSTLIDKTVILKHFDVKYYSGFSYLCVRTTRFTGHGLSVLPRKSARFITGNMYAGMPISEGTGKHAWTQCMELAVGPAGLDRLGVYIPNIFCTDIHGMGVDFNPRDMYAVAIFDAYNGFTPETKTTASPITNILALSGRYRVEGLGAPDPVTGLYSQCPTLVAGLGAGFDRLRSLVHRLNLPCDHAYAMILAAVDRGNVFETLPVIFSNVEYMRDLELLKRTVDATPADRNLYRETMGLIFADNYVIGKNGEHVFRANTKTVPPTIAALSPKVLGESLYNGAIYGDLEYGFSLKLAKYTGVTTSLRIDLNAV
ncbi:ORF39 [Ictalurid herpesvirus 1]|nr:ORF39 [Ictalurid herpesvirus 1]